MPIEQPREAVLRGLAACIGKLLLELFHLLDRGRKPALQIARIRNEGPCHLEDRGGACDYAVGLAGRSQLVDLLGNLVIGERRFPGNVDEGADHLSDHTGQFLADILDQRVVLCAQEALV